MFRSVVDGKAPVTLTGYNLESVFAPDARAENSVKFISQREQFCVCVQKTIILKEVNNFGDSLRRFTGGST
jgi:hypothetical protein